MSNDRFHHISDALRKALQGLDGPVDLSKSSTTKGFDNGESAKKRKALIEHNRAVLQKKAVTRAEREAEAQRLAEARRPQYPDARVMFLSHTLCSTCGQESGGLVHPQIFLRLRTIVGGKFDPTQFKYVPEKEYLEFPGGRLPRIIEHHTTKVSACPRCFTNAVHSFRGENTPASAQGPEEREGQNISFESASSSLTSLPSLSLTDQEGRSGTPTSDIKEKPSTPSTCELPNSASTSTNQNPDAPAVPIVSLITEERAHAKAPLRDPDAYMYEVN